MKKVYLVISAFLALFLSVFLDSNVTNFLVSHRNTYVNYLMVAVSSAVVEVVIFFIFTSLCLFYLRNNKYVLPLWLGMIISLIISFLLKLIVARTRPDVLALVIESSFSFPSGHSTLVFSSLPVIFRKFKNFKWVFLVLAVLVAFSRVYIGVHFLSDVLAGALIGYIIGYIVLNYFYPEE